jgi:hypothetical protein
VSVFFYGSWSLLVLSKEASFEERASISGSAASDGIVAGVEGDAIANIDGDAWTVELEWSSDGGASWHPSRIRRTPQVVAGKGLVVTLGADDNTPELGDGDFNDLVLEFVYLNAVVNPPGVGARPYEFTAPAEWFWPKRPSPAEKGGDGGCCCSCRCGGHGSATCSCG